MFEISHPKTRYEKYELLVKAALRCTNAETFRLLPLMVRYVMNMNFSPKISFVLGFISDDYEKKTNNLIFRILSVIYSADNLISQVFNTM